MDKEWYKVEELEKLQHEYDASYEEGKIDVKNDFHSYRMLNDGAGMDESAISSHNTNGAPAVVTAKTVEYLAKKYMKKDLKNGENRLRIADFGGGAGFIANALSQVFQEGRVFSYELAREASGYGRKHFTNVTFINKGIGEGDIMEEAPFDIVLANEFYPFTRNNDWGYQRTYVDTCLDNLRPGGILLIGLTKKPECLLDNMVKLKNKYAGQYVCMLERPYTKIYRLCGGVGVLSIMLTRFMNTRIPGHYMICLKKE